VQSKSRTLPTVYPSPRLVTSSFSGSIINLNTQFLDILSLNFRDQFYSRANQQQQLQFCVPLT